MPPRSLSRGRSAFTMVELLVVVAIIVVLLALLLPALLKVRETAARVRCLGNLSQIALAFQTYHDVQGYLPTGGKNACNVPIHPDARADCENPPTKDWGHCGPFDRTEWSWTYQILPYLEQRPLYDNPSDGAVYRSPVPSYYCPTRRAPRLFEGSAKVDYAGCAGTGRNGVLVRTGLPVVQINAGGIPDGASNTIMLGEKQLNISRFGLTHDDNEPCVAPGWDSEIYRVGSPDCPPAHDREHPSLTGPDPNVGSSRFGSSHPDTFNIVLADGSARSLGYDVDPRVFRRACVRNDIQPRSPGEL